MTPIVLTEANELTYESLLSLIQESQGQLSPIIVACDDIPLRKQIIDRYEDEAGEAEIASCRIFLGSEPSIRAALLNLRDENEYLQRNGKAVFTVIGAELLLRVKVKAEAAQSELDKFFGYLQWTREGFSEFRYPIVIWVTYRILKELSRRAPDFWSWRKAVLRFEAETPDESATEVLLNLPPTLNPKDSAHEDEFLPPLNELLAEIEKFKSRLPSSPNLAPLYEQLGRVYANRVITGQTTSLESEREAAIVAFETAILGYKDQDQKLLQSAALNRLGRFLYLQSRYTDAIAFFQKALATSRQIGDSNSEAKALNNLGNTFNSQGHYFSAIENYWKSLKIQTVILDRNEEANSFIGLGNASYSLGQYQKAIDFYQQSLEIQREIGDRDGERSSIIGLGNSYYSLEQYQKAIALYRQSLEIKPEAVKHISEATALVGLGNISYLMRQHQEAIDFYQQSLEIQREIGDLNGEASSLICLGNTYDSMGQYPKAIEFHQQSLKIKCEIGDRRGEAFSLSNLGNAYYSMGQYLKAIAFHQQSLEIRYEIGDRNGEADSLFNLGLAMSKVDQNEALQYLHKAKAIYEELQLDYKIKSCIDAIEKCREMLVLQSSSGS